MKKIICFLLGLMLCPNLFAQVYSNDAELVSEENGNVTLRSSGTADKKKEATALAIKSAFNTLFHSGVAGLKGGTPMIAVPRKDYDYRFFSESRYINYLTDEPKEVDDMKVTKKKKVVVTVTINTKSLIADLQHNSIAVSPTWVDGKKQVKATAALNPTIVIVPEVNSCNGTDFEAMRKAAENNEALKYALTRVTAEFAKHGYKTRNFITQLQNSKRDEIMRMGSKSDLKTKIVQQLPGDIVVKVDAKVLADNQNHIECNLNLSAVENQTNGNLAAATFPSGKYYKGSTGNTELVEYSMKKITADFFEQIKSSFEKMVADGREIYIDLTLSQSISDWDFDQDSPESGNNFKDALDDWLREHAQQSVYDMSNSTDKFVHIALNIPLWNAERGRSYTISNFSSDLRKFFRTQFGDNYKATITAQGQKLEIVIE